MKVQFWLSVFLVIVIAGCATTQIKRKEEQALRVRKLAEAFLAEKKYQPAYRELLNALEMAPKDPHVHYDLGIFYYEKKKFERSIEEYKIALELKPDFATARNNLGAVYMAMKEWDKAIETLLPLTEDYLYATPHFPHFLVGQAYFYKKDYPHALEHFQAALELKPDFPFAAHWLGKTLLEMGKPDQAISALENAMTQTPAAVFLLDLGRAYAQAGRFKEAETTLKKAACLATDDALQKDILSEQQRLRDKLRGK